MSLANFTDIIILLDRSSSMMSIAEPTRSGLNEFIKSQQETPGQARVTLAQFSSPFDFRYTFQNLPLGAVEPLTPLSYKPNGGSTALLDALARLIDDTGSRYASEPESSRPNKVVFVVVTDGQENASIKVKDEQLKERITRQQDVYKWQFVYLGANQDAIMEAQKYSIPMASAMTFNASEQGVSNMYLSVSDKIGTYRTGLSRTVAFDDSDRTNATEK